MSLETVVPQIHHETLGSLQFVKLDSHDMSAAVYQQLGLVDLVAKGYGFSGDMAYLTYQADIEYGPEAGKRKTLYFLLNEEGKAVSSVTIVPYDTLTTGRKFWGTLANKAPQVASQLKAQSETVANICGVVTLPEYKGNNLATQLMQYAVADTNPSVVVGHTKSPEAVAVRLKALSGDFSIAYGGRLLTPEAELEEAHAALKKAYHAAENQKLSNRGVYHLSTDILPPHVPVVDAQKYPLIADAFERVILDQKALGDTKTAVLPLIAIRKSAFAPVATEETSKAEKGGQAMIQGWIQKAAEVLPMKTIVAEVVATNNAIALQELGFPSYLIPIMQKWHHEGPDLLGAYAHPEYLSLFKLVAFGELRAFCKGLLLHGGGEFQDKKVGWYDGNTLRRSVLSPLKMGEFGEHTDIFGVSKKSTSLDRMSAHELQRAHDNFYAAIASLGHKLTQSLHSEIGHEIRAKLGIVGAMPHLEGELGIDAAAQLITGRLYDIATFFQSIIPSRGEMSVGDIIMQFEKKLTYAVFGAGMVDTESGFNGKLVSQDAHFLHLVRSSIQELTTAHPQGIGLLKAIIEPGEGLAALTQDAQRYMLTVNEKRDFVVVDHIGAERPLSDTEVMDFIFQALPLGKLETLAILAGGKTFVYATEHGIRPKLVDALGFQGQAKDYANALRVGADGEDGSEGIRLKDAPDFGIPLILAYVMLGPVGLQNIVLETLASGKSLELSTGELRKYFAKHLVHDMVGQ